MCPCAHVPPVPLSLLLSLWLWRDDTTTVHAGTPSPDASEGDATTRSVIHDTFALLGYDRAVSTEGDASRYLRVC